MRFRERFYGFLEYVLAFMFIRGGVNVLWSEIDPVFLPGIFTYLVGEFAIVVYGLMWIFTGIALLLGKYAKNKRLHKNSLFVMYLTCVYVLVLSIAVNGIGVGQLLTVGVGIVSAALWLRWKFKTEYISLDEFSSLQEHDERH